MTPIYKNIELPNVTTALAQNVSTLPFCVIDSK